MNYLWIPILALLLSSCARNGFIATPNPDEISTITYTKNTQNSRQSWRFINNDLTMRYTHQAKNGRIITNKVKKATSNDFNWMITELEKTQYAKLDTPSKIESSSYVGGQRRPHNAPEVMTIETLGGMHTFQKKGNIDFPAGFHKVTRVMPRIYNAR